jgi:hypothetical protein
MKKVIITSLVAFAALGASAVQAEEVDWTVSQQCVNYDGTLLGPGEFQIVWPTEAVEPNGYVIPEGSTGTLLNNYPWPCGPIVATGLPPVPAVETTDAQSAPAAVAIAPAPLAIAVRIIAQDTFLLDGRW